MSWQDCWLLDADINRSKDCLVLWVKDGGRTDALDYEFYPSLFVSSPCLQSCGDQKYLLTAVSSHPAVREVSLVYRFVSVYDSSRRPVIRVRTTPLSVPSLARDLRRLPGATVFHADIDPVQQFFIGHDVFPFGRVRIYREGPVARAVQCLDRREDTEYTVPPLTTVHLAVCTRGEHLVPHRDDPVECIALRQRDRVYRVQCPDERDTLLSFQDTFDRIDPDVVITRGGDGFLFPHLAHRARAHGIDLVLSRDGSPLSVRAPRPQSFWQYNHVAYRPGPPVLLNGRIHVDEETSLYYSPQGIEGIVEASRIALIRPQQAARMSIGGVNAAIQTYTAYKLDILVPPVGRNPESLKSVSSLSAADRGGLVLQPSPDVYEDVVECDFASMYPTLMLTRNISPETICMGHECPYDQRSCVEVPGLGLKVCRQRRGIIPEALRLVIAKRDAFKRLVTEGRDADRYGRMQHTLKGVLVSCFGYLGFRNARFGRAEAHAAVTAIGRDVLLRAKDIAEDMGFEVIHGIVDSIWLRHADGPDVHLVEEFCELVTGEVDIPMRSNGIYDWMVIPSLRSRPRLAPINRYYGLFYNGSIKARGLALRRRDTCTYVYDCQMAVLRTLARGHGRRGFLKMLPQAREVCQTFIDRLYERDVDIRDLVVHERLSRSPGEHRVLSPAAVAAQQLAAHGMHLHAGQVVDYIVVEPGVTRQTGRVLALPLVVPSTRYDPDAYARMCLRAFEELVPAHYLHLAVTHGQ